MYPASKLGLIAGTETRGRYVDARFVADRPGNGSRLSAAKSPALLAASLGLNAASLSTRICQGSGRDFGVTRTDSVSTTTLIAPAPRGGPRAEPSETISGEEPGY
jgi:hypothetical protein